MRHSLKTGFSFGLTSGIITTLGLLVGLSAATNSRMVVLAGVLTIAIVDAFSDAFGIHISEESEGKHTQREIWESTLATFVSKFFFAATFIVPVLLLEIPAAVIASLLWGLFLLAVFSFMLAREQNESPFKMVAEHLIIALVVVAITNHVGTWISLAFA